MFRRIDETYTRIADWTSEWAGRWPHFAFWFVAMLAWFALGPAMDYSNTWQLIANTPTTLVELFLGILILAAANRVEKRMFQILDQIESLEERLLVDLEDR